MTTVSNAIRKQVTDRIKADMKVLNAHYGTNHAAPRVAYDVRGQNGGYVSSRDNWNVIHLNPILLNENIDEMVNQTTPHELAHHWDHKINGDHNRTRGGKRSVHGPRWKAIMRVLGVSPDRCHTMDTSNARVRTKNKYDYKCSGCGHVMAVGPVLHKRLQGGQHRWHKGCGSSTHLEFVEALGQVTYGEAKAARASQNQLTPKPTKPKASKTRRPRKGSTKKARAQAIIDRCPSTGRDGIIAKFISELEMTQAGANTYYYNLVTNA